MTEHPEHLTDAHLRALAIVEAVQRRDWPGLDALTRDLLPPLPPAGSPHRPRFARMREDIRDVVAALAVLADEGHQSPDWIELARQRALRDR